MKKIDGELEAEYVIRNTIRAEETLHSLARGVMKVICLRRGGEFVETKDESCYMQNVIEDWALSDRGPVCAPFWVHARILSVNTGAPVEVLPSVPSCLSFLSCIVDSGSISWPVD